MKRTLKALAWLLAYPDEALLAVLPDLLAEIKADGALGRGSVVSLNNLVETLRADEPIEAQERYVALFDRSRQVSLYLFEHVHGDSRDRGMAMVSLRELYAAAGLRAESNELPDYLPMYLEYLSVLPREAAHRSLRDVGPILQAIHGRLVERQSAYAAPFSALLELAELAPAAVRSASEPRDDTPEALDKAWEEAAVTFGPANDPAGGGACGPASAMLDRMKAMDAALAAREATT